PPQSVKTCETPSCLSARATTRPPCIAIRFVLRVGSVPLGPRARCPSGPSGPELDVLDVRDLLLEIRRELLLHARLDLPHALAAHAELVADLLQRHGLLVAHERLQAALVDDEVLALERLPERARRPPDHVVVLLVGDGLGSLLRGRQKIKESRVLALAHGR